jgi:hypothetical protein
MALGTLTFVEATTWGNRRVRVYDVQLTSGANYTTAGETVTPQQVKMGRRIVQVVSAGMSGAGQTTAYSIGANHQANGSVKLQGFVSNGASPALLNEAPANTNLSAGTVRVTFIGY